jgi:hypothetical protein
MAASIMAVRPDRLAASPRAIASSRSASVAADRYSALTAAANASTRYGDMTLQVSRLSDVR